MNLKMAVLVKRKPIPINDTMAHATNITDDARRLWVMFMVTSMPVGGAETLLVNLVRGMDRSRFAPEICCTKEPGPLGEMLQTEMPVHSRMLRGKFDLRVLPRLWSLLRRRQIDAVVTVGAGDKMFWGRLAARLARVPVVMSALHSTGWPDGVGRLNRLLTPLTDAFIGVADAHGEFLVEHEHFPCEKVHTIYNGVDTVRFIPRDATAIRQSLGIPQNAPVVGIVAALRPEKNHELFLTAAQQIIRRVPKTRFLVIGDGPCRTSLEQLSHRLDLTRAVSFLGSRSDVPELLSALDVFALTSHNEANPVSILEALSTGCPVVAPEVGSVGETVRPGETGYLFPAGNLEALTTAVVGLLEDPAKRRQLGSQGRRFVEQHWSLDGMVHGYQALIEKLYAQKIHRRPRLSANPITKSASKEMA